MDGSQKLPQRLLGTIRDRLEAGAPITLLAVAVASWMRFAMGRDEKRERIVLNDPMAERILATAYAAGADAPTPDAGSIATALMGLREIFGTDLPGDTRFTGPVTAALATLLAKGAAATIDAASRA
jgi:fructuronate reductase